MSTAVEIANAYIALQVKAPGIQNDIARALGSSGVRNEVQNQGRSIGGVMLGAVAGAAAAATSKAISTISSSIGAAISRVDTMNNFPKIMQNLGYSTEDASSSIDTMSEKLQGLPTALNTMAGVVQQLAPLTGGLGEATDLSLALNNALLAGGKSTDIQANALEQYVQMLAVGKVDMTAWRSLVSAMPGQVNQLSESLLGAGAGQMDLYEAMKDGRVSFDEFNGAILRLNEEGTGAFASFQDQAKDATGGIATGFANMQTAVVRNLANIIAKLQPVITAVVTGGTAMANALGPFVISVIDAAIAVGGWAQANRDWLVPAGIFVGTLTAIITAVRLVTAVKLAWAAAMGGAAIATYLSGTSLAVYNGLVKAQQIATGIATAAQWAWNAALTANPIGIIITLIAGLVAALVYFFTQTEVGKQVWENVTSAIATAAIWLWETVLQPVFKAIGDVFTWIWTYMIKPVVDLVINYFRLWGAIAIWLWENVLSPVFAKIGEIFTWVWKSIIEPVIGWISEKVELLGLGFTLLYERYVKPAFEAVGDVLSSVWKWIDKHVFAPFKVGIDLIGQAFGNVAKTIGEVWEGIKRATAGPINFVLDVVWNNGLRSFWNDMVGELGLNDMKLPKADPIKFAQGGVLPGYTPGRDVHEFYSPTGGRLSLSGGEAIMRPEFTRAVGGPAGVARLNAAARNGQAFANGGVVDFFGDVWDNVQKAASVAWEFVSNPGGAIQKHIIDGLIRPLMATGPGGVIGRAIGELPVQLVKNLAGSFASAAPSAPGGSGMGWESMWQIVKGRFPNATLNSAYRPGSMTVNGGQSYHALGRAIDLPARMEIFEWLKQTFPNSRELIHSPAGNRQLLNGKEHYWGGAVRAQHFNHVHWAMANGGVVPKLYDQGGWIPHGGVAVNMSGRPEAVLTPAQSEALVNGRGGVTNITVQALPGMSPQEQAELVARELRWS